MQKLILIPILMLLSFFTSVSVNAHHSNTYYPYEIGVTNQVMPGIIIAKRLVTIDGRSGAGTFAGAIAGGTGGSFIGGDAVSHIAGAIGGAIVGGVLGNAIESGIQQRRAFEYFIRLRNGSTISVVQGLRVNYLLNQRVLVILGSYGNRTRIIPDYNAPKYYVSHANFKNRQPKTKQNITRAFDKNSDLIKLAMARNTQLDVKRKMA